MSDSGPTSPTNHGFFASKLHKTKQSLSKAFSKGLDTNKDINHNKSLNLSTNSSNSSSTSSFHANASSSSFSASNLTELSMFKQTNSNNLVRKSSLASSNPSLTNASLSTTSTKTNLHEIFELDKLINDLSLSKSYSEQDQTRKQSISLNENYVDIDNDDIREQDVVVVGVTSVKEHAKMLNRLNTSTELRDQNELPPRSRNNSVKDNTTNKKSVTPVKNVELEPIDISNACQLEKEWLVVCSRCDYMEMAKMLSKNPYLAQKKDPFTGVS